MAEVANIRLVPCGICGRNFNEKALARHQPICQKNNSKKPRKVYNPDNKSHIPQLDTKVTVTTPTIRKAGGLNRYQDKPISTKSSKPDWRSKREDMIKQIRYAREADRAEKLGHAMPEAPKLAHDPTDEYTQCPYCSRKFAEPAATRHIQFCETKSKRIGASPAKPGYDLAKKKQAIRTGYKPPRLTTKSNTDVFKARVPISASSSSRSVRQSATSLGSGGSRSIRGPGSNSSVTKIAPASRQASGNAPRTSTQKSQPVNKKACRECNTNIPIDWARFCPMCGVKRVSIR